MNQSFDSAIKNLGRALALTVVMLSVHLPTHAYTAVATYNGHPDWVWVTQNAPSAEAADRQVVARCAQEVVKIRGSVSDCQIFYRSSKKGWYATSCGQAGCAVATGHKTLKDAQDAAFEICTTNQKFCSTEMPAYGQEVVGAGSTDKAAK